MASSRQNGKMSVFERLSNSIKERVTRSNAYDEGRSCSMYRESNIAKRRRIQELEFVQSEMTSSTQTSPTTMTFNETLQPRQLAHRLSEQRNDVAACDVIVRSSSSVTSSLYAHRCVLAASSDYFKALFRHDTTDAKVIEAVIPASSHDVIESVITFIYTGMIEISFDTVEEMVRLADYLALSKVLELCEKFMTENLNDSNCLQFKVISDFHSLAKLSNRIQDYILPRMSMLVRRSDTVGLPVDVVRHWLSDNEMNYAREVDVLKLIQDMVASRTDTDEQMEMDQQVERETEREKARDLLHYVEFEYLPPEVIEREVLSNADTLDWLSARPELLERVMDMVGRNQVQGEGGHKDDIVEAILCRRLPPGPEEDLQVMLYRINDDAWRVLSQPRDERGVGLWRGLDAMVMHDGSLYALSSLVDEDKHPEGKEIKFFNRMDPQTGEWSALPPPRLVTGPTMLVSSASSSAGSDPLVFPRSLSCLLAIDRRGIVERYLTSERRWTCHCCPGLPGSPDDTIYLLPMITGTAKDDGASCDQLYVLRTFSAEFSFFSSRRRMSIHRLDADPRGGGGRGAGHWKQLSQRESSNLLNPSGDDYVNFFGYSISPKGLISLKDVLGHTRVEFDTTEVKWKTLPRTTTVPCLPGFIRHIYASINCSSSTSSTSSSSSFSSTSSSSSSTSSFSSRIYFIASSPIGSHIFVMFDSARGRFKMTHAPPYAISGLLCHVTLPKSSVELMCG